MTLSSHLLTMSHASDHFRRRLLPLTPSAPHILQVLNVPEPCDFFVMKNTEKNTEPRFCITQEESLNWPLSAPKLFRWPQELLWALLLSYTSE